MPEYESVSDSKLRSSIFTLDRHPKEKVKRISLTGNGNSSRKSFREIHQCVELFVCYGWMVTMGCLTVLFEVVVTGEYSGQSGDRGKCLTNPSLKSPYK